jgi:hypothetical protein
MKTEWSYEKQEIPRKSSGFPGPSKLKLRLRAESSKVLKLMKRASWLVQV